MNKNRNKMRLRPDIILIWIIILCSIFGIIALTITVIVAPDWIKALAIIIIYFIGWASAKYHSKL